MKLPKWVPKTPKPWNPAYRETWEIMTDNERRWSFIADVVIVLFLLIGVILL